MTELETVQRAKMYMDKLAQGIDPISGMPLPGDSALNQVRLARCFFYVSGILDQVIQNGGHVGAVEKEDFVITAEQLARVQVTPYPIRITEFTELILQATGSVTMKKPSAVKIIKWLEQQGFLVKEAAPDGKNRRVPTEAGRSLGLSTQVRQSKDGDYLAIYYDANAQRYLLANLPAILQAN